MTAEILTFGCRLNAHESAVIAGHLAPDADLLVVNTCAVTHEAERQARRAVARAHRAHPDRPIVVTGCASQIAPQHWASLPGVTSLVANDAKLRPESWGARSSPPPPGGRTRALLPVQGGCDHRCTFCIIPAGRGPSRSVPLERLAGQARALAAAGHLELVLTGVDIASYGRDLPDRPTLGQAVRHLLRAVPALPRLRLSSLDPAAIDGELWALLADEPRLLPHLHLSLQAASDLVLKRMRRRHDVAEAERVVERARALRPGIAIGADLIAGFPTETDALFAETLDFVRRNALPYLHVFPYSERPGTPAARMPAVPPPERRARAAALREVGAHAAAAFYATRIGHTVEVLTEASRPGGPSGHDAHFSPVRLHDASPPGRLVRARVTAADARGLLAEVA